VGLGDLASRSGGCKEGEGRGNCGVGRPRPVEVEDVRRGGERELWGIVKGYFRFLYRGQAEDICVGAPHVLNRGRWGNHSIQAYSKLYDNSAVEYTPLFISLLKFLHS